MTQKQILDRLTVMTHKQNTGQTYSHDTETNTGQTNTVMTHKQNTGQTNTVMTQSLNTGQTNTVMPHKQNIGQTNTVMTQTLNTGQTDTDKIPDRLTQS